MILFFYNLALLAALALSLPWWLLRLATTEKYREGLRERLGWVRAELLEAMRGRPVVWIHAVSVGEVLAVSRLVKTLDAALPEYRIAVSTTTRTGQALARERFGAERVFYCPLDLPWAVRAYLNALRPRLLVLAETEFWPNLLSGCARRGIPVAVVNARVSDRSWPRYRLLSRLWRTILSRLDCVLAQSATDAERLKAIGCRPERVSVAGNLKFDVRAAEEAEATRLLRKLAPGLRIVVAGSTLEGEESALLEVSAVSWVRRSAWRDQALESIPPLKPGQIVLLDTIGELASVYSLASVAFVGGSLIPAGGHNPLEPAQFGVPIVMGPHTFNFQAITDDLLAHRAVRIAEKQELAAALIELLKDGGNARAMGERSREVFASQAGATERSAQALIALLSEPTENARRA